MGVRKKETINDKLLARAREMFAVLKRVADESRSRSVKAEIAIVLEKADRDIPRLNRHGKQTKFQPALVEQVVKKNGGDKNAAAAELGCSLRTIYVALDRLK